MKYYLIAGEASGDLHASHLMQALKRRDEKAEFRFFGGDLMTAVGGQCVKHYRELAYMGFVPVLLHLPTILRNMKMCKQDINRWRPDVVILVDYPGFNLDIAKYVKAEGICPESGKRRVKSGKRRAESGKRIPYHRSATTSRRRYGLGRSIASSVSSAMLTNCSPSYPSRSISSRRNTIIPSTT